MGTNLAEKAPAEKPKSYRDEGSGCPCGETGDIVREGSLRRKDGGDGIGRRDTHGNAMPRDGIPKRSDSAIDGAVGRSDGGGDRDGSGEGRGSWGGRRGSGRRNGRGRRIARNTMHLRRIPMLARGACIGIDPWRKDFPSSNKRLHRSSQSPAQRGQRHLPFSSGSGEPFHPSSWMRLIASASLVASRMRAIPHTTHLKMKRASGKKRRPIHAKKLIGLIRTLDGTSPRPKLGMLWLHDRSSLPLRCRTNPKDLLVRERFAIESAAIQPVRANPGSNAGPPVARIQPVSRSNEHVFRDHSFDGNSPRSKKPHSGHSIVRQRDFGFCLTQRNSDLQHGHGWHPHPFADKSS